VTAAATDWPEVARRIEGVAAAPGRILVVADFDGTLADYHPDPMGAQPAVGARRVLRRLARIAATRRERLSLIVLSGRAAADLAGRVRVGGLGYLGNHGNESGDLARGVAAERLQVALTDGLAPFIPAAERLAAGLPPLVARVVGGDGPPGWFFVEPKGPAVAFHYRQAPDRDIARSQVYEAIGLAEQEGLTSDFERIDSRLIVEFQPRGAGAKGAAVDRLIQRLRPAAVVVLGDDAPDAEAFGVVAEARSGRSLVAGLSVGVKHDRPLHPSVIESADVIVSGPAGAMRVLRTLAARLEGDLEADTHTRA
jgi:trehalose 6-phosphate phosphatase